ncbi:Rho-binding antiterminator [Amphritea sp. 1_MG-2023]|uniref:Rho-binding antiterminator n=1 Tax=Amphritea sp. 1_MG-2023 TaxID=3062670 RepID=UPI0026E11E1E|nr:Rho-binding antiterminator [Amphritea sp. 1_MG-2023]MDO6562997.1 Rho-binding antiterminator [Amphritea sp. 1_MG-2023]
MTDYKPIQCDLHDGFELACMRRLVDQVIWQDNNGQLQRDKLRFINIDIRNGEECLIAADHNGQQLRIRLDRIQSKPPGC